MFSSAIRGRCPGSAPTSRISRARPKPGPWRTESLVLWAGKTGWPSPPNRVSFSENAGGFRDARGPFRRHPAALSRGLGLGGWRSRARRGVRISHGSSVPGRAGGPDGCRPARNGFGAAIGHVGHRPTANIRGSRGCGRSAFGPGRSGGGDHPRQARRRRSHQRLQYRRCRRASGFLRQRGPAGRYG